MVDGLAVEGTGGWWQGEGGELALAAIAMVAVCAKALRKQRVQWAKEDSGEDARRR